MLGQNLPREGGEFHSKTPMLYQKIIKQDRIQASKFFAVKVEAFLNLVESIQKALWQDSQYRSILQDLGKGKSVQDYSLDSSFQLVLFTDWLVVPNDPTFQCSWTPWPREDSQTCQEGFSLAWHDSS
ncbi:hypothetical protein O181_123664 [Austropuccinia psidii MF-1]|uniref:Uncharacterized protein n=1 Tax=Austropuccinia psidii MF-1 TaxID=1389203 RepID=A0A9Q3KMW5_9BASI|nr:hypothetical protein [Austropuccinia psidii MF-1]